MNPETVPCEICATQTQMTGTKRCDRCWELESRMHRDPSITAMILWRSPANILALADIRTIGSVSAQMLTPEHREAVKHLRKQLTIKPEDAEPRNYPKARRH